MAASIITRGSRTVDVLNPYARPNVTVELARQKDPSMICTYTTGDRIEGTVTVTAAHLISFDEIDIKLEGTPPHD
jgi:hypothetical protein